MKKVVSILSVIAIFGFGNAGLEAAANPPKFKKQTEAKTFAKKPVVSATHKIRKKHVGKPHHIAHQSAGKKAVKPKASGVKSNPIAHKSVGEKAVKPKASGIKSNPIAHKSVRKKHANGAAKHKARVASKSHAKGAAKSKARRAAKH
jgi:hypothetical protein